MPIQTLLNIKKLLPTPFQTLGPFYPLPENKNTTNDLTTAQTQGEILEFSGQVFTVDAEAIGHASVEIWQANAFGRYLHPDDTNVLAPLDLNFRYHGESRCNDEGFFSFKTVLPGSYPAEEGWLRPPHIHVKILAAGYTPLTTQIYFANESLNNRDQIFNQLSEEEKNSLMMPLEEKITRGVRTFKGKLNLVLSKYY